MQVTTVLYINISMYSKTNELTNHFLLHSFPFLLFV